MLALNSQCREMESKEEEDDRIRTIDSLRGRLLAERVASKAAKNESQNLAKRLELLEKKLAEEIRFKNRAEKRLKYALKRLESLRLLDDGKILEFSESCESSSSQNCFLGFQGSEESKSDLKKEDSDQCRSPRSAKGMTISDDLSGSSSHQQLVSRGERSWSSAETVQSQLKDGPTSIEDGRDADLRELSDDASRLPCDQGQSEEAVKGNGSLALALVPVSNQMNSDDWRPQSQDDVQGVLLTLRNVKEQLLHSMQRRTGVY